VFVATKSEILGYNFRWMWHQVGEGITSDERREHGHTLIEERMMNVADNRLARRTPYL